MYEFLVSYDDERKIFLLEWDEKSPRIEAALHKAGGAFDDFNTYRFPGITATALKKAVAVAKQFGEVNYGGTARIQIAKLRDQAASIKELNTPGADAEVSELLKAEAPETAAALRDYQRVGVKFIEDNDYTLLADHPGLGKTITTIAAMVSAGVEGDILVLAPTSAVGITWPAEIHKWAPDDEFIRVTGSKKKREEKLFALKRKSSKKRRWILCNIEMARVKYHESFSRDGKNVPSRYEYTYGELFFIDHWLKGAKAKNPRLWSAIIVDESHKALITDKSQSYKQAQTRRGLGKLRTAEGGKRVAMSGTPFRGKLENLWGTLNWLSPKEYSAYWEWIKRWFETEDGYFGGTKVQEVSAGAEADFYAAMAPFTLRRTKAEVAPELPPKMYAGSIPDGIDYEPGEELGLIGHWLEMGPKQKKAYQDMEEDAMVRLDSGILVANGVLSELTRLKQFSGTYGRIDRKEDSEGYEVEVFRPEFPSNKFDWLVEFLEELGIVKGSMAKGPDDRKVIVASQFTSVIDLFDEGLRKKGIQSLKITGAVTGDKREQAQIKFQSDDGPQVMLLNTIAGGVSLTLDRADDIIILDETFIPDDQEQVEDRVHRVSRNHNVTVHYLRSVGSIEEKIARKTHLRDNVQKKILDGERGVDFARKLVAEA